MLFLTFLYTGPHKVVWYWSPHNAGMQVCVCMCVYVYKLSVEIPQMLNSLIPKWNISQTMVGDSEVSNWSGVSAQRTGHYLRNIQGGVKLKWNMTSLEILIVSL